MRSENNKYVIVLSTGTEDGGARATLAMALAVSLQAMGGDVAVYFNFQAGVWALQGATAHIEIRGFDSLETYMKIFEDAGGEFYVCASCFEQLPSVDPNTCDAEGMKRMRRGVVPAGVTTLASLLAERKAVSF